jgi:hypothetical protein
VILLLSDVLATAAFEKGGEQPEGKPDEAGLGGLRGGGRQLETTNVLSTLTASFVHSTTKPTESTGATSHSLRSRYHSKFSLAVALLYQALAMIRGVYYFDTSSLTSSSPPSPHVSALALPRKTPLSTPYLCQPKALPFSSLTIDKAAFCPSSPPLSSEDNSRSLFFTWTLPCLASLPLTGPSFLLQPHLLMTITSSRLTL